MENVDDVMDEIREQMDLANEVSNAISQPVGFGMELDEVCLRVFGVGLIHVDFFVG